jgi:hypothetical protein
MSFDWVSRAAVFVGALNPLDLVSHYQSAERDVDTPGLAMADQSGNLFRSGLFADAQGGQHLIFDCGSHNGSSSLRKEQFSQTTFFEFCDFLS